MSLAGDIAERLQRLAFTSGGEGLQWRVLGFADALRGQRNSPARASFSTRAAWVAASRRYSHGWTEGDATRERRNARAGARMEGWS